MSTIIYIIIPLTVITYNRIFQNKMMNSSRLEHIPIFIFRDKFIKRSFLIPICTGKNQPHLISQDITAPQRC